MVKHFSHRHELELCPTMPQPVHQDDEAFFCFVCEYELDLLHHSDDDTAPVIYQCTKSSNSKCHFYLHDLCFQLPREILHNSHPKHPLLLSLPPYQNDNRGEFICNACGESGTCFRFHCPSCMFNLHVQCATLPQTPSRREHHQHPLTLLFSVPNPRNNVQQKMTRICDLCEGSISQGCWLYYCKDCDYGTHLHCSTAEADDHHHEKPLLQSI